MNGEAISTRCTEKKNGSLYHEASETAKTHALITDSQVDEQLSSKKGSAKRVGDFLGRGEVEKKSWSL